MNMPRREFLKRAVAAGALCSAAPAALAQAAPGKKTAPFVGIHIAAHSFYDEGFDHCLDFLQETAAVNALFISSNYYYGAMVRPKELMGDHGVPIRDNKGRKLSRIYFKYDDARYRDTSLRHQATDPAADYAGREIFADLAEPARQRGLKLFERMYEPTSQALKAHIKNGEKVLTLDLAGKPANKPCWNHPEFRAWTVASIRDLFLTYPLDGIQYEAERVGPLSSLLYGGGQPTCFCEHCVKQGRERGLDVQRVRSGFQTLWDFMQSVKSGSPRASDGTFVTVLRVLMEFPELLSWEHAQLAANEEIHKQIYEAVKAIRPTAQVGRHVDQMQSSADLIYRAAMPPARMAETCDFIKPILYHEIFGPRVRGWVVDALKKGPLAELTEEQSLSLYYAFVGYNPATEPKLDELEAKGLSAEYVHRETRRFVDDVQGRCAIYSGIGTDIPKGGGWGNKAWASDPDSIYRATKRVFDAGAKGIVICREYEENRRESLQAIGRAVREIGNQ